MDETNGGEMGYSTVDINPVATTALRGYRYYRTVRYLIF